MRLSIVEICLPPASLLTVEGELDLATAGQVESAVAASAAAGNLDVALDLAGVTFMDCSGIHALSASQRIVNGGGGRLRLVALSPSVERILVPSHLRRLLTVGTLLAS